MRIVLLPMPVRIDEKTGEPFDDGVTFQDPNGVYLNEGDKTSPNVQVIVKGPAAHATAVYAVAASEKLGRRLRISEVRSLEATDPAEAAKVREIGFLSIMLEPA